EVEQPAPGAPWVGDAGSPRIAIRAPPQGERLADVDEDVVEARAAQEAADAVGDEALRDSVQGDRHAGPMQPDQSRLELYMLVADRFQGPADPPRVRAGGRGAGLREMLGQQPIEWLHGGIEGAVALARQRKRERQQLH